MTKTSLKPTVFVQSGDFPQEFDDQGPFTWLSREVVIRVESDGGWLEIIGKSIADGFVTILGKDHRTEIILNKDAPVRLRIPIASTAGTQILKLAFSNAAVPDNDNRCLSFMVRQLRVESMKTPDALVPDIVFSRPFSIDQLGVWPAGWLRMSVRYLNESMLMVTGILLAPIDRQSKIALTINGLVPEHFRYRLFNRELPQLGNAAFEGKIDLASQKNDLLRFGSIFEATGEQATPWYQDWYFSRQREELPMPGLANMARIGAASEDWFLFSGKTFVDKLPQVIRSVGLDPSSFTAVLDWGCGCGRLTRHLLKHGYGRIAGIDIDPINVAWCQANIPGCDFRLVNVDPPTDFGNGEFHLVIGHSVLTHLSELDQFIWLSELQRIVKPGGLVIVTIMTGSAASLGGLAAADYISLHSQGFVDVGWQQDGVDVQRPGYYRRIFHDIGYVLRNWGLLFEVCAVLEGFADYQSAVVLKRATVATSV